MHRANFVIILIRFSMGIYKILFIYWSPAIAGLFVCVANVQGETPCVGDVANFAFPKAGWEMPKRYVYYALRKIR